jgi:hypothetical protein
VTGRLLTPSWLTTAGGGLEGSSTGGLSRALFVELRKRKFRKAALLESLDFGVGTCCPCACDWRFAACACSSELAILSTVSLLERSTAVSIVGFFGLRLNLGILSIAPEFGKDRCEAPEKLRQMLWLVAVFARTRGPNNFSGESPSIRRKCEGDLGERSGIASGPPGQWRSGRDRIRVVDEGGGIKLSQDEANGRFGAMVESSYAVGIVGESKMAREI